MAHAQATSLPIEQPVITPAMAYGRTQQLVFSGSFCKFTMTADNAFRVALWHDTTNYGVVFSNIDEFLAPNGDKIGNNLRRQFVNTFVTKYYPSFPKARLLMEVIDHGQGTQQGFIAKAECSNGVDGKVAYDYSGSGSSVWKVSPSGELPTTCDNAAVTVWGGDQGVQGAKWVGAGDCRTSSATSSTMYEFNFAAVAAANARGPPTSGTAAVGALYSAPVPGQQQTGAAPVAPVVPAAASAVPSATANTVAAALKPAVAPVAPVKPPVAPVKPPVAPVQPAVAPVQPAATTTTGTVAPVAAE